MNAAMGWEATRAAMEAMVCNAQELSLESLADPLGRKDEVRRIIDVMRARTSTVVTLCGFAGTGKSRLALAVAKVLQRERQAPWLRLKPSSTDHTSNHTPLKSSIAGLYTKWVDGLVSGLDAPLDDLINLVADKPFTLIIDGAIADKALDETLTTALQRCPNLAVIEAVRYPSRKDGRHIVPVKPLRVPPQAPTATAGSVSSSSLDFMLNRIRSFSNGVEMTEESIECILAVCRLLDGIPRAMESAVKWFELFPPRKVAELAESEPLLLASGPTNEGEDNWILDAVLTLSDRVSHSEWKLLVHLASRAEPWTLEQILVEYRGDSHELIEYLHDLLVLGLIRPADHLEEHPVFFEVLNLVRCVLR
ncbi:hypothetical protein [Streptomyces sp. enrichment culture]|uniref:hypothetical protein n=1 Tax=Streptomyces sp. enrichment culture TaxID=1795815 RepID=UPI003F5452DC